MAMMMTFLKFQTYMYANVVNIWIQFRNKDGKHGQWSFLALEPPAS